MVKKILKNEKGFTLIELMIVVTIIGILATLSEPSFRQAIVKAREAALKKDLYIFRDVIDQYYADNGVYPPSLQDIVSKGYIRALPIDPFTKASDTWVEVMVEGDGKETGVYDVKSGSDLVGTNNVSYNQW
jgi:general secretion pathway protein G